MFGSSLASAASVLFALSFSMTSTLPTIEFPTMPLSQTTSGTNVDSAKSQSSSDNSTPAATPASPATQENDPLQRPLPEKKKRFAKQSQEGSAYTHWVDEEVPWIITDEERAAFKLLSNDAERAKFVERFWELRDPTPGTIQNEFPDTSEAHT